MPFFKRLGQATGRKRMHICQKFPNGGAAAVCSSRVSRATSWLPNQIAQPQLHVWLSSGGMTHGHFKQRKATVGAFLRCLEILTLSWCMFCNLHFLGPKDRKIWFWDIGHIMTYYVLYPRNIAERYDFWDVSDHYDNPYGFMFDLLQSWTSF